MVTALIGPLALLATAGLVDADTGDCPSAVAIAERLEPLLSPSRESRGVRAHVERRGDILHVELRDEKGLVLRSRELSAAAPCADLAGAVAVVLGAVWQSAPAPDLPALQLSSKLPAPRPAPPPRRPFEIAASAWVSFAGTSAVAAPGATIEASIAPRGRRLGARVSFLGAGLREEFLGPGRVAYTRFALGAGPRYSLAKGRFILSLYGEGLLGVVLVRGTGFVESYSSTDVDLGLGGGVRIGLRLGPVVPFVGGAVLGWLRPQALQVAGLSSTAELPRFEVLLSAGVAFGTYP